MKALAALVMGLSCGACAMRPEDLGHEPALSPPGSGLVAIYAPGAAEYGATRNRSRSGGLSLDLYRDRRANRVGDIVTINIQINDRATFDSTMDRARDSKINDSLNFSFGLFGASSKGNGAFDAASQTSTKGQGSIERSEKIQLSVAAVVTDVLPNGNMVVMGSQEVRVNFEIRVLDVSGIVKPTDISRDNTIPYDRIAEARISYGGRGRLSEVQQPGFGQQIHDALAPF